MADLGENTKVTLKIGGVVVIALFLLGVGARYGEWTKERSYTQITLVEHEERLDKLEAAVTEVKDLVKDARRVQDAAAKDAATAAANTTGIVYDLGQLKVELAKQGLSWPARGE